MAITSNVESKVIRTVSDLPNPCYVAFTAHPDWIALVTGFMGDYKFTFACPHCGLFCRVDLQEDTSDILYSSSTDPKTLKKFICSNEKQPV